MTAFWEDHDDFNNLQGFRKSPEKQIASSVKKFLRQVHE